MRKISVALAVAALAAAAMPFSAQARCGGCGIAAGVVAGAAAGAIVGSAIANSPPAVYAVPAPVDGVPPADYVPTAEDGPPADLPTCYFEQQQIWIDGAYRLRNVRVCE